MEEVRTIRKAGRSMGAVTLVAAVAAMTVCFAFTRLASPRASTVSLLLSSEDKMEGFLGKARSGMATLKRALPVVGPRYSGDIAVLRGIYEKGEKEMGKLQGEVKDEEIRKAAAKKMTAVRKHAEHKAAKEAHVSSLSQIKMEAGLMHKLVAHDEQSIARLIAQMPPKDARVFPAQAKEVASVLKDTMKKLAGIDKAAAKKATRTALARVATASDANAKQLDADKAADDEESRALSSEEDAKDVLDTINALPKAVHKAKTAAKKARTQSLASVPASDSTDPLVESKTRSWGTVYNPEANKYALDGAAQKQYQQWKSQVDKISDVHDPLDDKSARDPISQLKTDDWWKSKDYRIGASSGPHAQDDAWWVHDHKGRGW